jgi:hypothetical protein
MSETTERLIEAFSNKNSIETYIANLEQLKANGSITEDEYVSVSDEYYERLGLATSGIVQLKNELKKELEVTRGELAVRRRELAMLETRHKIGELSAEQYKESEKELAPRVAKLDRDAIELDTLINANSLAEIGALSGAERKAAPERTYSGPSGVPTRDKVPQKDKKILKKEPPREKVKEPRTPVDTAQAVKSFSKSWVRLLMAGCGVFLLASAFLPWISASEKLGAGYGSSSGMNVSVILGIAVLICGIIAVITAVLLSGTKNRIIQIILGCIAVAAIVFVIVTGRLPLLSELARSFMVLNAGFYLCVIASVIMLATGIFVKR